MKELKSDTHDLDHVIGLLKEGTLKAKGRFNPDYTLDFDCPDPASRGYLHRVAYIQKEAWHEYKFKKRSCELVNGDDHSSYTYIHIDRKKYERAIHGLNVNNVGAKPQYNKERFYKELGVYINQNEHKKVSDHGAWCVRILADLPYFEELENAGLPVPSLEWVKEATLETWLGLKSPKKI